MKNKNTMIIVAVVLIIVAAAGGFFGGMMYQKNQTPSIGGTAGRGSYAGRFGGQAGQNSSFRSARGQVLDMNNDSMTIKLSNGSTEIVVLSASTAFMQSTKAALSDVKTGDTINVVGTANSDGSVTAQQVQINPPQGGFPTRPTGGAGQGAAPAQ